MEKSIYPFSLVEKPNEDLKQYGREIQVVQCENSCTFSIDVLTVGADGGIRGITTFAEGLYEDDLPDTVSDCWAHVRVTATTRVGNDDILYKFVPGWTHDLPALIAGITEVSLYFHDNDTDTMECVDNNPAGIDAYANRNGSFYVRAEDYDEALRQIEEHDELGIER